MSLRATLHWMRRVDAIRTHDHQNLDYGRLFSLIALSLGGLMIGVDATIINVGLASIKQEMLFSASGLVWVVNAYLLTFAGFMIFLGRLADYWGHRRVFVLSVAVFTLASVGCGTATNQELLIGGRTIQGVAAAGVWVTALSQVLHLFNSPKARARALGIFGFVNTVGGSLALLLGGALTSLLNWHWIFLVNGPVGLTVLVLGMLFLPRDLPASGSRPDLNLVGALAITSSLVLALYAVVLMGSAEGDPRRACVFLLASVVVGVLFLVCEIRARTPFTPAALRRRRTLIVGVVTELLVSGALYTWYFIGSLYFELVLKWSPLRVGLAFLPATQCAAVCSLWLVSRLMGRYDKRALLITGLAIISIGLGVFSLAPVRQAYPTLLLPAMLLIGLGLGLAASPLTLIALEDVSAAETGIASGIVNTSSTFGASLGVSISVSIAASHTQRLMRLTSDDLGALNGGYHLAFVFAALSSTLAALLAVSLLRKST